MQLEQRYLEELRKLHTDARYFAAEHPSSARALANPDEHGAELRQLLQGVAYLTATLQQRVLAESSRLLSQQVEALSPACARGFPAMTVLEFRHRNSAATRPIQVATGTEVAATHGPHQSCRFQTTRAIEVPAIARLRSSTSSVPGHPPQTNIVFELPDECVTFDSIEFFIAGPYRTAALLFVHILRNTSRIDYILDGEIALSTSAHGNLVIPSWEPLDFDLGDYPEATALLQQYTVLPESFLFFELKHLQRIAKAGPGRVLEIRLNHSAPFPPQCSQLRDVVRVGCVPAINLFREFGEPITLIDNCHEYFLRPTQQQQAKYRLFGIRSVSVSSSSHRRKLDLSPCLRPPTQPLEHPVGRYMTLRVPGSDNVILQIEPTPQINAGDVVSSEIVCQSLPQDIEHLREGDVQHHTRSTPPALTASNVCRVGHGLRSRAHEEMSWDAYGWLGQRTAARPSLLWLQQTLRLFLPAHPRAEALSSAIRDLRTQVKDIVYQGQLARTLECEIRLSAEHLAGRGDIWIYTKLIYYILQDWAPLDTPVQLLTLLIGGASKSPNDFGKQSCEFAHGFASHPLGPHTDDSEGSAHK